MNKNKDIDLVNLTNKLQSEDQHYSKIVKILQIMYWVLIPIYMIYIIRLILNGDSINRIIGGICFLLSMLTLAISFKKIQKEYSNVDYSLPTLLMLKKAVRRYTPFQLKIFWVFFAVALFDVGLVLNRPENENKWLIQAVFLGAILIAMLIGLIIWHKRYKALRDDSLTLIKQLTN